MDVVRIRRAYEEGKTSICCRCVAEGLRPEHCFYRPVGMKQSPSTNEPVCEFHHKYEIDYRGPITCRGEKVAERGPVKKAKWFVRRKARKLERIARGK